MSKSAQSDSLNEDPIVGALRDVLFASDASGIAVLLRGPWGAGKTWLWDNLLRVDPARGKRALISASLFGAASLEHIGKRTIGASLLQADHDERTANKVKSTFKRAVSLSKKVLGEKFALDFTHSIFEPLELVPERAVVCLDDLERAAPSIEPETISGAVSYLVLVKRCRVLVIANTDELGEEGAKKWAALREKLFLFEYELTPRRATLETVVARCAPSMSPAERSLMVAVNIRCRNYNLRRLERVARLLDMVKARLKRELSEHMISCMFMLVTERDTGTLQGSDHYELLPTRFHVMGAKEEAKQRALEAMEFASLFFSSFQEYQFYPPFLTLVREGYVGGELEAQFSAPELPESERLIWELQGSARWWSMTEQEMRSWVARANAILRNHDIAIPWSVVVGLMGYMALAARDLDEDVFGPLANDIDKRLNGCAIDNPRPVLYPPMLNPENPRHSELQSLERRFALARASVERARVSEAIREALTSSDPRFTRAIFESDSFVGTIQSEMEQLLARFDTNRQFVLAVLEYLVDRLEGDDQRKALAARLMKLSSDRVGRRRLETLATRLGYEATAAVEAVTG